MEPMDQQNNEAVLDASTESLGPVLTPTRSEAWGSNGAPYLSRLIEPRSRQSSESSASSLHAPSEKSTSSSSSNSFAIGPPIASFPEEAAAQDPNEDELVRLSRWIWSSSIANSETEQPESPYGGLRGPVINYNNRHTLREGCGLVPNQENGSSGCPVYQIEASTKPKTTREAARTMPLSTGSMLAQISDEFHGSVTNMTVKRAVHEMLAEKSEQNKNVPSTKDTRLKKRIRTPSRDEKKPEKVEIGYLVGKLKSLQGEKKDIQLEKAIIQRREDIIEKQVEEIIAELNAKLSTENEQ